MVGRIRAWQRSWHGRSKIEKVEFQSTVTWHALPWIFLLSWVSVPLGLSLRHDLAPQLFGWTLIVLAAAQCLQANRSLRRSVDHYLRRAPVPRRDLVLAGVLMSATMGLAVGLQAVDGAPSQMLGLTALFVPMPFAQSLAFSATIRAYAVRMALVVAASVIAFALAGARGGELAATGFIIAFASFLALISTRCGAWTLSVMWEADRAREVEARLAVAEERLRFGRDLHDVMGRNLAVIALKSELAVQLARRGRPEAVDQMVEVQRIAQESQREVREVVRGYREVDLKVELVGAQGVLEAAGIDCRVIGSGAALPASVQSALGWVVREAATNVLRHGDAGRCDIALAVSEGRATLTVENDGVPEVAPQGQGSGLAGLRERLAEVDGTLDTVSGDGVFRLAVQVPLPPSRGPAPSGRQGERAGQKHGPEREQEREAA
ncbi:histidine kinase [Streptomyces atriruber]|uniref:histidine kinase n=1 Tax=Streptomyces atriruber TaxID=545121 RepID=UPI0007C7FA24|nr:histidine kinase [Streptomyces atriruber]